MFSKNKNKQTKNLQERSVPSIISADLKITGDLLSSGEVQVDGNVSGDIRAKVLLVGETANITGEIYADTVRVHGNVTGQISAKFVNLSKSAHVVGDIHHENLSIQEGAFLEGHMVHVGEIDPKTKTDTDTPPSSLSKPASVDGKPAEDRVNLVVKSGNNPAPTQKQTSPLNAVKVSTGGKVVSGK